MEFITILYQALFSVLVLFILTKILGYRQVSQFSMFEYVNSITIGSIAAEMAINLDGEYLRIMFAMFVYTFFVIILSKLSQKSITLRRLINGKAIMLYHDGKIYNKNLKKAKMDADEFLAECRIAGYFDLSQINSATLEPNGKISFLPVTKDRPLTPGDLGVTAKQEELFANVIVDGSILEYNLKHIGKDREWLDGKLRENNIHQIDTVFLAICNKRGDFHVYPKVDQIIDRDILG